MGRLLLIAAVVAATGCANAKPGGGAGDVDAPSSPTDGSTGVDGCGDNCDVDGDGVPDRVDVCPGTPAGQIVNMVGCSDSQVNPTLEETFPPYGLTFTPTGDLGRAGGLTWNYAGIMRRDLFHIYWVVCDDPVTPCGLSLDGAVDVPAESWVFSASASDLPRGKLVFTNTTHIRLDNGSTPQLNGRLTVSIVDGGGAALPFDTLAGLGVTGRAATHGAEIPGSGFKVVVLAEVQEAAGPWTPYLDYYDAAQTPATGASAATSFGGWFYDE